MACWTMSKNRKGILIAPFSNSEIRDWPIEHFAELVGLLLERVPEREVIHVIGTPNQRLGANEIVRKHPTARVVNQCGRLAWSEVVAMIAEASCVVGNNSGIAHLAGHLGTPTVCVFGGSHQRREWRSQGFNVVTVSRAIGCSPCQLDHQSSSPYAKACLREIAPETVAEAGMTIMSRVAAREALVGKDSLETDLSRMAGTA